MKKRRDLLLGTVMLIFSVYIIKTSLHYGTMKLVDYAVSPAFVPVCLGILMAILSICLIVRELFALKKQRIENTSSGETKSEETKKEDRPERKSVLIWICALALIVFYVFFLLKTLGFIAATVLFLTVYFCLLGVKPLWKAILVGILVTLLFWLAFSVGFKIPFPRGVLF